MKANTLQDDLKAARTELEALRQDLPAFHGLIADNQAELTRLRDGRAPLEKQVEAQARVNVSSQLLEQHIGDIQTAQAEVARLEAQERREQTLAKMGEQAKRSTKNRRELEKAVHEGSEALGRALTTMAQAFSAIREERAAFALLGRELVPEFPGHVPFNNSVQEQATKAQCEVVLSELEARGATLTDVLNSATGKHTRLDSETRPLPTPEHAHLLWKIFSEAVAKNQPHLYGNIDLPVRRH